MKRVLIVSYFYNELEEIGSHRLRGLGKYLPEFGWEPVILTSGESSNGGGLPIVVGTPYDDHIKMWKSRFGFDSDSSVKDHLKVSNAKQSDFFYSKMLDIWDEVFTYPDRQKGWYSHALSKGKELASSMKFDAILSSSSPFTSHIVAHQIKKMTGAPWLADFRDLYTQNHYYHYSNLRKMMDQHLEMKILATTDAFATVSPPLVDTLGRLHWYRPIRSIPNGFNPDDINPGKPLTKDFTVTYSGSLYRGKRDPSSFFAALKKLMDRGAIRPDSDFKVDFYGRMDDWVRQEVEDYGVGGVVKIHELLPRAEVLDIQRRSQLLLLLNWDDPKEKGVFTGKVFEYLAAMRPVVSIGPKGSVLEGLFSETQAGVHLASIDDIADHVEMSYREFKARGSLQYKGRIDRIEKYSHRNMAKTFAEILDRMTGRVFN